MPERIRSFVLFVHHRSEPRGAPAGLSYLIFRSDVPAEVGATA